MFSIALNYSYAKVVIIGFDIGNYLMLYLQAKRVTVIISKPNNGSQYGSHFIHFCNLSSLCRTSYLQQAATARIWFSHSIAATIAWACGV
jgi:hypothetical protein